MTTQTNEARTPTDIVVTKRASDYHAALAGTEGRMWGCGSTPGAAIGDLVAAHQRELGIRIVWPVAPETEPR